MKNRKFTIFCFLIISLFSFFNLIKTNSDDYYQIMDQYSFNLKNTKDKSNLDKFYNNFHREGDLTLYDKYFTLAPKKNNTFGFIYTKGDINSEDLEVQIKFRINNFREQGSAFAVWFFKDEMKKESENPDRSFVGFKPDFNGVGILLFTPPKLTIEAKTFMFVQQNDGKQKKTQTGIKKVDLSNSCNENFHDRTVKLTLILKTSQNNLAIKFDNKEYLHYPCLDHVKIPNFKPPFKIGISAMNGIIEDNQYLDHVEIEKFTVFNCNDTLKSNYSTLMNVTYPQNLNYTSDSKDLLYNDLVENFGGFVENYNSLENPVYMKELNEKIDNTIISLSEIKKHMESKEILENKKQVENLENVLKTYKDYVINLQESFKDLKEKLIKFMSNSNKDSNRILDSVNGNIQSTVTTLEYEIFFREVDKLKREWDNNKIKQALSNQLNIMLSERIDDIVNSLKSAEGTHIKMAAKLVIKLF
jgi:hypothetical protein